MEKDVDKYKEEFDLIRMKDKDKASRLNRKRKLEKHWEIMQWITSLIEEYEDKWRTGVILNRTEETVLRKFATYDELQEVDRLDD